MPVIEITLLIIPLILALGAFIYIIILFFGPPFIPTPMPIIKKVIKATNLSQKDLVADLGSGDGRFLIEAARTGAKAKGWEINPFLVLWTRILCVRYNLTKKITIYQKNYLTADLSDVTVVFLYNLPPFLPNIEKKLKKELKKRTIIVSYKFQLKTLKPTKYIAPNLYLYTINPNSGKINL